MEDDLDRWFDEFLAEYKRRQALKPVRQKHSYVADLIRLLLPYPNGLTRGMVLHDLERQRRADGLPIPPKFEEAVQSNYNHFSVDSSVYKKRGAPPEEGFFFSPDGKGSGRWAVNRERAAAWLRTRFEESDS